MRAQDIAIRTLYAEFQDSVFKRFSIKQETTSEWTFISKTLKKKKYWYRQRYINGRPIQKYYAPSNPETDKLVSEKRRTYAENKRLLNKLIMDERKRAAMLKRGGVPSLDPGTSDVIEVLSGAYLTYKGGVLIGSHAFAAYAGMFGAFFEGRSLRTLDVDVALDKNITAYIKTVINIGELLRSTGVHFRYVPSLSSKYPPHSLMGSSGIRVDLLTPMRGRPRGNVQIQNIADVGVEPLRFLDFLIRDPIDAVLIGTKGGIPVTIPHPAKFAIHKLIISSGRPATDSAKKAKDIMQAEQLIAICAEETPHELKSAYSSAIKNGKKWKKYVENGTSLLSPETMQILENLN